MVLNNKILLIVWLIFFLYLNGCIANLNNESLNDYERKLRVTAATLNTYIGSSENDVKQDFGSPTEIRNEPGKISTYYQIEKVSFNEIWYYIYRKGVPGFNAKGSTKIFYFNKGNVVSVDAM